MTDVCNCTEFLKRVSPDKYICRGLSKTRGNVLRMSVFFTMAGENSELKNWIPFNYECKFELNWPYPTGS